MNPEDQTAPEKMMFDAKLQEFANRIGLICQEEAYDRIKQLWKQLKLSKKNLRIGDEPVL